MNPLRYWDYSPRQRALMPRDQVAGFIDFELMEQGVQKVETPTLRQLQPVEMATGTYFQVVSGYTDVAVFRTMEEAAAFCGLRPVKRDYNYECGNRYYYAEDLPDLTIKPVQLANEADYKNLVEVLRENKAVEEANEKAQREFKETCKIMDSASDGVFNDWADQQDEEGKNQRILSTWRRYLEMSQGNAYVATNFLLKVFTQGQISSAVEWLGEDWTAAQPVYEEPPA